MADILNKRLLTIEQMATILGMSVSGLRKKVYRGEVPYVKVGTNNSGLRFDPDEMSKMIEERTVQPFRKGV